MLCRAVYEELGKYGDLENQVLCRERVEELEPSVRYCRHKIGESNLKTSELLQIGEMEGPALDLFKAKLEVSMVFYQNLCMTCFFSCLLLSVSSVIACFYSVALSFEKLNSGNNSVIVDEAFFLIIKMILRTWSSVSRMFMLDQFHSSLFYTCEWFSLHWILSRASC